MGWDLPTVSGNMCKCQLKVKEPKWEKLGRQDRDTAPIICLDSCFLNLLEPQNTVGFPHATPKPHQAIQANIGACIVLSWKRNPFSQTKAKYLLLILIIPSYAFLRFYSHIFICGFPRRFFSFGGEEENWFCIPTGKPSKKTLKVSSRRLEQIDTDEHYIQKNSELGSAVDPIQPMQGEKTRIWMLETVKCEHHPFYEGKMVTFPILNKLHFQSEMPR